MNANFGAQAMGGTSPAQPSPAAKPAGGMDMMAIMEYIKKLPPAQQQEYIAKISKDYTGRGSALDEQMAQANMLRDAPAVTGQAVNGVLVGAGGLEGLAQGIGKYKGMKEAKRIGEAREGLSMDKEAGLSNAMQAILRGS